MRFLGGWKAGPSVSQFKDLVGSSANLDPLELPLLCPMRFISSLEATSKKECVRAQGQAWVQLGRKSTCVSLLRTASLTGIILEWEPIFETL